MVQETVHRPPQVSWTKIGEAVGRPGQDDGIPDALHDLEVELADHWRRSRALVRRLARAVRPDLDPAAYSLVTVAARDLGAASSTVSFFRSLGGTVGVSVLGAVLASRVTGLTTEGLAAAGVAPTGGGSTGIGQLNELPPAIADIVRIAYGDGTARIFLISAVLAAVALITVLFIREVPLRMQSGQELARDQEQAQRATAGSGTGPI